MTGIEVNSRVSAVTVYRGRAMITREVTLSLKAGVHSLLFTGLPANLDRNSLQVSGIGEATLGGCMFETVHFTEDVSEQASGLLKRQQDLSDELSVQELKLKRLEGEKAFTEKIATCVTTPQQAEVTSGERANSSQDYLNVSLWKDLTKFYRERHSAIDLEKLEINRKNREIQKELKKLSAELKGLGHRRTRSQDIVRVDVEKATEGEITLHLSYAVPGPSWKPVYNLRSTGYSDSLHLEYDALVSQATGEDWKEIELKLSTAKISVSGAMPTLDPWRISFYHPPVPQPLRSNDRKMKSARPRSEAMDTAAFSAGAEEELLLEPAPMAPKEASVEQAGTGVLFAVAGTSGVTGDNNETRVSLSRVDLPAEYLYRSVPKLIEFAYRIARFTNSSEFPILPGAVNIFQDGSLIANSVFELIMPGQEADASLGVDEGIKVEYKFIRKFRKSEGLINKRTSMQFEYCVKLENNTGREVELEVIDQFPISQDKDLEVKPVSPEIRKDQKEISLDDESMITWNLKLPPTEKRELPMTYVVEYPVDRRLTGL